LVVGGGTQSSGKRHELRHPLTNLLILAEVENGHDWGRGRFWIRRSTDIPSTAEPDCWLGQEAGW